jgi:hypothetical protein
MDFKLGNAIPGYYSRRSTVRKSSQVYVLDLAPIFSQIIRNNRDWAIATAVLDVTLSSLAHTISNTYCWVLNSHLFHLCPGPILRQLAPETEPISVTWRKEVGVRPRLGPSLKSVPKTATNTSEKGGEGGEDGWGGWE